MGHKTSTLLFLAERVQAESTFVTSGKTIPNKVR